MSVLLEFSIYPMDQGESVSDAVAEAVKIIDASGLPYHLHAMGTVIEGELDEVLDVLRRCVEELAKKSNRVSASVKLDCRKGKENRLLDKKTSVEKKIGKKLP